MWRKVPASEEQELTIKATTFTGDADLYGAFMISAIMEWPYGCEHNLTCKEMNRQAWVGHAATCIAINCPEYITRSAWWMLTQEQRNKANEKADIAIKIWEEQYAKDKDWNRRINGGPPQDFLDIRHVRESLLIVQRWKGQHSNATSSSAGGEKKKKKVRPDAHRFGGPIQIDNRSCDRLF